ncbi:MAG: PsiF family protein [Pseudomonadota bacterium]
MNKLMTALMMAAVLAATPFAASAKTEQQNKMGVCNKEAAAKSLKGDERKTFMKGCLSGDAAAAPAKAEPAAAAAKPKNAMGACSTASKGMKGAEHKKFMSECLKAKGPENMKK